MNKITSFFIITFFLFFASLVIFPQKTIAVESIECQVVNLALADADNDGVPEILASNDTTATQKASFPACTSVDTGELGFKIPSLGDLLTFAIRAFFVIAGLAALFYLLLGALAWVTSGGDKDAVAAAREKIQAAVLGMILIVAVLAIIWTLEQVIFNRRICLGLSCPLTLPGLIEGNGSVFQYGGVSVTNTNDAFCCVCAKDDGTYGDRINTRLAQCGDDGEGKSF